MVWDEFRGETRERVCEQEGPRNNERRDCRDPFRNTSLPLSAAETGAALSLESLRASPSSTAHPSPIRPQGETTRQGTSAGINRGRAGRVGERRLVRSHLAGLGEGHAHGESLVQSTMLRHSLHDRWADLVPRWECRDMTIAWDLHDFIVVSV